MRNHRTILVMLVVALTALASPGYLLAEGDVTLDGQSGLFTLRSGYTTGQGIFSFSTYLNHWDRRVTSVPNFDPLWTDWDMDFERLSVAIGYGITDRLELSLMAPYDKYEAFGQDPDDPTLVQHGFLNGRLFRREIDASGAGNLRLGLKWQLAANDTYGLALNAFVDPSTGDDDEAVVTGDTGFGAGLNWSVQDWVFNVGYYDPGDPDVGERSDEVLLGIGYGRTLTDQVEWITELQGNIKTEGDGEHDDADLTTGFRLRLTDESPWALNAALRVDLSDVGNFDGDYSPWGGLVGLTYSRGAGARRAKPELTVIKRGNGSGTVTSNPAGIDCGPTCTAEYKRKTLVAVTATPAAGSTFEGFSGDCTGGTVLMDADKTCIATFQLIPPPPKPPAEMYTLTVILAGNGEGRVTSMPGDIDCGSRCEDTFKDGTDVKLKAMPAPGSMLAGFSSECTGGNVRMTSDKTCTVTFEKRPQVMTCPDPGPKSKRRRWACNASREIVYFENGEAGLAEVQQSKLCDLVQHLDACPALSVCIAGRTAADEEMAIGTSRGDGIAYFLEYQGLSADRYDVAPNCSAPSEPDKGSRADIYLK